MSNLPTINSLPSVQEFQTMKDLGNMAVKSGFLPTSIKTPEQAIIIMLKGRELGIPPMQAFSSIAVVNGKPTMSAELMLSMIYKNVSGAIVDFAKTDNNECVIEAKRPNGKKTKFTFSMEDAKRANLTGKGPWVTYPSAMLRARCISAMARAMFPDALSGVVYTPEELGAQVDEDLNIIDVPTDDQPPIEIEQAAPIANPLNENKDVKLKDFVITFGKHKGNTLGSMDAFDLDNYLSWIVESSKEKNKPIVGQVKEFVDHAEAYLCSIETPLTNN